VLDKDDPNNEKILYWTYKNGFESENSEDEGVTYRRELRKYKKYQINKHGADENKPYLRKREILPFEKAMLKYGGTEIIKQVSGKKLSSNDIKEVYEWVNSK
jgi:hypothetical protein